MGHRVKNLLAVVHGLVDQSLRASATLDEARERIVNRLGSLATAQDLALSPMRDAGLAEAVNAAIRAIGDDRISVDLKADGQIDPQSARGLVLALHELATNAVKYGALSQRGGRVRVMSQLGEGDEIRVTWKETGGPLVETPKRQGFGSKLIARALPRSGETARLSYESGGVECVFRLRAVNRTIARALDPTPD
jgi:two-component sensor histidine kinase